MVRVSKGKGFGMDGLINEEGKLEDGRGLDRGVVVRVKYGN